MSNTGTAPRKPIPDGLAGLIATPWTVSSPSSPVLVFASALMGQPMDLVFTRFEIVALGLSVLVAKQLIANGKLRQVCGLFRRY